VIPANPRLLMLFHVPAKEKVASPTGTDHFLRRDFVREIAAA
jgi:hypothetical protein